MKNSLIGRISRILGITLTFAEGKHALVICKYLNPAVGKLELSQDLTRSD